MTSSQPQSHNKIAHLKEQKHYKLIVTAVDIFKLLELQYGRQPNLPQFAVRFFYYFPCKNYNTIKIAIQKIRFLDITFQLFHLF